MLFVLNVLDTQGKGLQSVMQGTAPCIDIDLTKRQILTTDNTGETDEEIKEDQIS